VELDFLCVTVGWLVDSRTLLEAVRTKVSLQQGDIDEILNPTLLSKDRSTKVIRLLWRKLNASLYKMLAERYRPGNYVTTVDNLKVAFIIVACIILHLQ